jgi:hypothetical protein
MLIGCTKTPPKLPEGACCGSKSGVGRVPIALLVEADTDAAIDAGMYTGENMPMPDPAERAGGGGTAKSELPPPLTTSAALVPVAKALDCNASSLYPPIPAGVEGAEADSQLMACMVEARCMAGRGSGVAKLMLPPVSGFSGVAMLLEMKPPPCSPAEAAAAGISYEKRGGRRRVEVAVGAPPWPAAAAGGDCCGGSSSSLTRGLAISTNHCGHFCFSFCVASFPFSESGWKNTGGHDEGLVCARGSSVRKRCFFFAVRTAVAAADGFNGAGTLMMFVWRTEEEDGGSADGVAEEG